MYDSNLILFRGKIASNIEMFHAKANFAKKETINIQNHQKFLSKADNLIHEYNKEFQNILGEENFKNYEKLHKRRTALLLDLKTSCDIEGYNKHRIESIVRSEKIIKKSGVDYSKIDKLRLKYDELIFRKIEEELFNGIEGESKNKYKTKNLDFRPPYHGQFYSYRWSRRGGENPYLRSYENGNTGVIGNYSRNTNNNAGEMDHAIVSYESGIGIWFTMPSTGQVKIRVELEGVNSYFSGSYNKECFNTSGSISQKEKLFAQIINPTVSPKVYLQSTSNTNEFASNDLLSDDSQVWDRELLPSGLMILVPSTNHVRNYTAIPGVFQQGTTVLITIGIQTLNRFNTSNIAMNSRVRSENFIKEIGVFSSGDE